MCGEWVDGGRRGVHALIDVVVFPSDMIGKGLPSQSHRRTSRRHSMRSTSSTAVDQQLGRRGFASSLVMVTLLAIAASWVVQGSSASMSTGPVQRSFNIFQAASEDTGGDNSDAISKALSLAGTSTPQVSDINSTARATSIAYRAAVATPPPSSSALASAASSAEPTSAASAKEEKDTWSWVRLRHSLGVAGPLLRNGRSHGCSLLLPLLANPIGHARSASSRCTQRR